MGGWRGKMIFWLVIYFAGFATAVYCLAPVEEAKGADAGVQSERGFAHSVLKSDEFAKSFNVGMRKCIDFGGDAAEKASRLIKEKFSERETDG